MSKREWIVLAAIVVAVGVSITFEPDHSAMSGHGDGGAMLIEAPPSARTVTLAVAGMT